MAVHLQRTDQQRRRVMGNNAPKLGTGLFGFRRSAVEQIIAEGEARLDEAEGRLRAAESRVSELQEELETTKRRNAQIDEQIQRLQSHVSSASGEAPTVRAVPSRQGPKDRRRRPAMKEE
jgi:chromosome segregation ATPase